jgi:3-hydroxyacyl-CoA dehydrogenase
MAALWNIENPRYQAFLREMLTDTLSYMANVTPNVSDRIVEVDDALIGGFGWNVGPFHLLDMLSDIVWGNDVSTFVQKLQQTGEQRFYFNKNGEHFYFDFASGAMTALPRPPDVLFIKDLKKAGKVVEDLGEASLIDLGEDVLCLEWRTKMGTLNPAITSALDSARERTERDFAALVIAGAGDPFSVGFDLALLSTLMEEKRWDEIDGIMASLQQALQRIKYGIKPVICAVNGFALGGGCEVMLHCSAVQAGFESSIGLPEANAGLVPTGGGIAQVLIRAMNSNSVDPFADVRLVWERLRTARFSSSAPEAESLGYLRSSDSISIHPDRLLYEARQHALELAKDYATPEHISVKVMGLSGLARFRWELHNLLRANRLTVHDGRVATALANVLCGGQLVHATEVSEQYLLNVEREVFLSLAGTPESLARIKHLLATGKPLRN